MCFPTRRAVMLALLVCVAVPTTLVALQINDNPKFSPIDEGAHWDYVTRVSHGSVPRIGQNLQPSTLRELSCRQTDLNGLVVPKCTTKHLAAHQFPGFAQQYEAQHPPTYYAITVPLRWVAMHVFGFSDVGGTRLTGILWLVLGLLLLWCAGRVLDLAPEVIGLGALLLATAPVVIYHTAVISNDVPSIFVGSLVALVAALAYKRPGRWMTPALAATGFFAAAIKTTDLFPVAAIAAVFAVQAWTRRPAGAPTHAVATVKGLVRRWMPDGGALLFGGLLASSIWVLLNHQLALIDPKDIAAFGVLRVRPVGPGTILREVPILLGPVTDSFVSPGTLGGNLQQFVTPLLRFLLIGGALSGLFVSARKWQHWLGLSVVATLLAGGFAFGVGLKLNYDIDPGLSGRYAMSMGPLLVLVVVAAASGKWVIRGLWVFAAASLGITLYALVF
jgi:hypothetical protein